MFLLNRELFKIDIADLIYIEGAKHYLYLHTSKETFRLRSTMGDLHSTASDRSLLLLRQILFVNLEWISTSQGKQRVCKWKGIIDFPFL